MASSRTALALPVILLSLSIAGCASYYLRRAESAAGEERWDAAVENYERALRKDSGNTSAKAKLEYATERAAAAHRSAAEAHRQAGDFEQAIAELRRSLEYRADPATKSLLDLTLAAKRRSDADSLASRATMEEARGLLLDARSSFEGALALDPSRADVSDGLARVKDRIQSAQEIARKAQKALEAGNLDVAESLARKAQEFHVRDSVALSVAEAVPQERSAREAEKDARAADAAGDYEAAAVLARETVAYRLNPARLALLNELEHKAADHFRDEGDAALNAQRWEEAIRLYGKSQSFGSVDPLMEEKIRSARHGLEVSLALKAQAGGDLDAAVEHFRRANEIKEDPAVSEKLAELSPTASNTSSSAGQPMSGREIYDSRRGSVVIVETTTSLGSGVVIDDGIVLTNRHVLSGVTGYVITASGQRVPYFRVWRHAFADIAAIQVTGLVADPAPPGTGLRLRPGDGVSVIGNPQGLAFSFSEGSVAAVGRSLDGLTQLIQFTAPISPGSSGGPVFDDHGRVVGLATATLATGQALNFAVPIEYGIELVRGIR